MAYGKTIELFLVNGTADSLVTAELSNWNGKALKIPRIEVANCNRDDIKQAGVYFLFCKEDDGSDAVYIGEAENIRDRLIQHLRDYQNDKEPFYWNTAVFFTGRDLNKAHIRYLEDRFVNEARNSKRYKVLTKNTYHNTVLKESQIASMEEFIDNVKVLINVLGYKVLEPLDVKSVKIDERDSYLYLNRGKRKAKGLVTSEGFVLLKGTQINPIVAPSLVQGLKERRDELTQKGIIKDYNVQEDILFNSSSSAAAFALGYSVSGPNVWKSRDGRTLKEIENQNTGE